MGCRIWAMCKSTRQPRQGEKAQKRQPEMQAPNHAHLHLTLIRGSGLWARLGRHRSRSRTHRVHFPGLCDSGEDSNTHSEERFGERFAGISDPTRPLILAMGSNGRLGVYAADEPLSQAPLPNAWQFPQVSTCTIRFISFGNAVDTLRGKEKSSPLDHSIKTLDSDVKLE